MITASEVKSHKSTRASSSKRSYEPVVSFRYEINGVSYTSNQFRYGIGWASSGDPGARGAWNIVNQFPVKSDVTVYYNPENPAEAVLLPGISGFDLFWCLLAFPFNFLFVGLWWRTFSLRFLQRKEPFGRDATLIQRGTQTIVVMGNSHPFFLARLCTGILSVLAALFVAVFVGIYPSMFSIGLIVTIILFLSIAVYVWRKATLGKGAWGDLIVDEFTKQLTCNTRKEQPSIAFSAISNLSIQEKAENSVSSYRPVIHYKDGKNLEEQQLSLESWDEKKDAEVFITWLKTKTRFCPA